MNELNEIIEQGLSEWRRGASDCENNQEPDPTGCGMYKDGYRKRLKELADEQVRIG